MNRRTIVSKIRQLVRKRSKDEAMVEAIKQVSDVLDQIFDKRIENVAKIDAKRLQAQEMLKDYNFSAGNPNFRLVLLIQNIWRLSNGNPILFMRNLRAQRRFIRGYQGELAEAILKQSETTEREFGPEDRFNILISVDAVITQKGTDETYVTGFLKTPPHTSEIYQATEQIRNGKIKSRIRKAVDILTGQEVEYLTRYLAEVESWRSEAINIDIRSCQAAANSFFFGREEPYLGLISRFNDESVEKFSNSNRAYLQLSRFDQQLEYLDGLLREIESNKNGDWSDFENFYRNAKKIAKKVIAKRFGNNELAVWMLQERKKMREFRQRWIQDMKEQIARLVAERRTKVILPFIHHMEIFFRSRIAELRAMEKPEVAELKEALEPLIRLERESAEDILAGVVDEKERVKKRIKRLRSQFEYLSNKCVDASRDFFYAKWETVDVGIRQRLHTRLKSAFEYINKMTPYIKNSRQIAESNLEDVSLSDELKLLHNLSIASKGAESAGYYLSSTGEIFTDREMNIKIRELESRMEIVEKHYAKLDVFIKDEITFLLQPVSQVKVPKQHRGDDYGESATRTA